MVGAESGGSDDEAGDGDSSCVRVTGGWAPELALTLIFSTLSQITANISNVFAFSG